MDFVTLQTEFFSRGFEYLNDGGAGVAQAAKWINRAMQEIDGEAQAMGYPGWPYLEATAIGSAPLVVSDARSFESVYDASTNRVLPRRARRELQVEYGDSLAQTGTPLYWFRSGVGTVNTYPVAASTLSVRYFKVAPDLSANSDVPLSPARFHMAIVDLAASLAHRYAGNNVMADAMAQEAQRVVDKMTMEMLGSEPVSMPLVGGDC